MSVAYNFNIFNGELSPLFEGNWYEHLSVRHRHPLSTFYLLHEFNTAEFNADNLRYSFMLSETKVSSNIFDVGLYLIPHGELLTSRRPFRIREDMLGIPPGVRPYIWSFNNSYSIPVGSLITIHLSHLSIVEDMFTDIILNHLDKILRMNTHICCSLTDYCNKRGTPVELMYHVHQVAIEYGHVS